MRLSEEFRTPLGGTELMQRELERRLAPELKSKVNIIVSRVRELHPTLPNVLWLHDLADDRESQHLADAESRARFAKLVFVSNWQFQQFHDKLGVPHADKVVIKNAINPIEPHDKPRGGPLRLIYHTTPHRGLRLLVAVFIYVYENLTRNIHLDVFSSLKIYDREDLDCDYEDIFRICRTHPGITYHGCQPNAVVREALKKAHIFAYPSIWRETSCIAAIEALSAGCCVICPRYGALPETTGDFAYSYEWHEDPGSHAQTFTSVLSELLRAFERPELQSRLRLQKQVIDQFYSWDQRIAEWNQLLATLA